MRDTDPDHRTAARTQRHARGRRHKAVRIAIAIAAAALIILLLTESGSTFRFMMARFAAFILRLF